jgi:predicted  nucleic acid-binding Zn-ribbon protein
MNTKKKKLRRTLFNVDESDSIEEECLGDSVDEGNFNTISHSGGKVVGYVSRNRQLEQAIEDYRQKASKAKKLTTEMTDYRTAMKARTVELAEKEGRLTEWESSLVKQAEELRVSQEKFNTYIAKKSAEMLSKANEIKEKIESLNKLQSLFTDKNKQIVDKSKYIEEVEKDLKVNLAKFESDKYNLEMNRKQFQLEKEEFSIHRDDVLTKYLEMKTIQDEIKLKNQSLEEMDAKMKQKQDELHRLDQKKDDLTNVLLELNSRIEARLKEKNLREKEIELQRDGLQDKINECNIKLLEMNKLKQDLCERESYIKIQKDISKELELKISAMELSESIFSRNRGSTVGAQKILNKSHNHIGNFTLSSIKTNK